MEGESPPSDSIPTSTSDAGEESKMDPPRKPSSIDTDDDLLDMNMSRQPSEKITENVDDLVNDLETLLGESSDSPSNLDNSTLREKELTTQQAESTLKDIPNYKDAISKASAKEPIKNEAEEATVATSSDDQIGEPDCAAEELASEASIASSSKSSAEEGIEDQSDKPTALTSINAETVTSNTDEEHTFSQSDGEAEICINLGTSEVENDPAQDIEANTKDSIDEPAEEMEPEPSTKETMDETTEEMEPKLSTKETTDEPAAKMEPEPSTKDTVDESADEIEPEPSTKETMDEPAEEIELSANETINEPAKEMEPESSTNETMDEPAEEIEPSAKSSMDEPAVEMELEPSSGETIHTPAEETEPEPSIKESIDESSDQIEPEPIDDSVSNSEQANVKIIELNCEIAQVSSNSEDGVAATELEKIIEDETAAAILSIEITQSLPIIEEQHSVSESMKPECDSLEEKLECTREVDQEVHSAVEIICDTQQTEQDSALQILTEINEQDKQKQTDLEEILETKSTYDNQQATAAQGIPDIIADTEPTESELAVQGLIKSSGDQTEHLEEENSLGPQTEDEAAVLTIIGTTTDFAVAKDIQEPDSYEPVVDQSIKTKEEIAEVKKAQSESIEIEIQQVHEEPQILPEKILTPQSSEEVTSATEPVEHVKEDAQVSVPESTSKKDIDMEEKRQPETIKEVPLSSEPKIQQINSELHEETKEVLPVEASETVVNKTEKKGADITGVSKNDDKEPNSEAETKDELELKRETEKEKRDIESDPSSKTHTQPLSIAVEDEEKEDTIKATQKAQGSEQEGSKGCLKMTITKHADKMHSILKVFDPEEKQAVAQEEEAHEEPIPKLIIKSKQQQGSPKTSSKKCHSPPSASTDSHSPLKITLKTAGKSEETSARKTSPKLTVKDETEPKHQSPRITIKPIPKPESETEEPVTSTPKVTIKAVKRTLDVSGESEPGDEGPSPKLTIKAIAKVIDTEEDIASTHSPKITIKPIKKSDDESQSSPKSKEDQEEVRERLVLKINKGAVSSQKEPKKRDHPPSEPAAQEEKSEKLAKIKLKFSKGGGHPHIVSPKEGVRRHTRTEDVKKTEEVKKEEEMEVDKAEDENTSTAEVQKLAQSDGTTPIKESKKKEETSNADQSSAMDTTPVALPTPTPKKRGRPRKNPLIPREESKELPTYVSSPKPEETSSAAPSPTPSVESTSSIGGHSTGGTPLSEGRPKRSCRGQNVMATLGIKPRKPRGGGRGRGGKVNMGDRTPNESFEDTSQHSLDFSQSSDPESRKTPEIEPPKKSGRGRRRKTSDRHKDTASDTSSVISEAISLDDDDHSEPKAKVAKEEPAQQTEEETEEEKAQRELANTKRRERLLAQLQKARSKRKYHAREKALEMQKLKLEGGDPENTSQHDSSRNSSFSGNEKSRHTFGSPEKPRQGGSTGVVSSGGLQESLVDEETRMSADQGFRETKNVLSSEVGAEDSQSSLHSTGTGESGKNSTRYSRNRMEVHQELDANVCTVDQVAEYYWDNGGPYMLQEQVSLYLGVTSFKRKYPNIIRRGVDMQERDYIRENNFASEAMCNLGLTAVISHDIIDIMYKDFPDKYEEYCRFSTEKQTKELISKHKAFSQQGQNQKIFDKTELMEQAIQSTLHWNKEFNKARMEQRKAVMDLQTYTIQYPKNRIKQMKKPLVGSYPVALVPGQFTDYYKDLTAVEINNLPLNSLGTGYLESSEDSDSSDDDSDSSSTSSSSDYSSDEDCKLCAKHNQATPAAKNTTTTS